MSIKHLALATLTAATLGCAAQNPAAPTPMQGVPLLTYHNIPATLPDGTVMWVCATQPRTYCKNGVCERTIDHYIQPMPCPDVPID